MVRVIFSAHLKNMEKSWNLKNILDSVTEIVTPFLMVQILTCLTIARHRFQAFRHIEQRSLSLPL